MNPLARLSVAALIAATCLPLCAENLLTNPGFEEGTIDALPGWHKQPWAKGVAIDDTESHSGQRSLRVFAHGGMETDLLQYRGGRLRVTGWMKTRDVVRGPSAAWHQAALQIISYDYEGKPVGHSDVRLMEGTHDWTRVESTVTLSDAVSGVSVVCQLWGEDVKGTAWFDDITLESLDAPREERAPIDLDAAHLQVDFSKDLGPFRHSWVGSDVGYSDRVLTETQRTGMAMLHGIGFEYIRMHDCLHDPRIYSEDAEGNAVYTWDGFDARIQAVVDAGMKPVVVLETTPPQFATGDSGKSWTNPYPPKGEDGYAKWQALVQATVAHCRQTWGEAIHEWYFEVWNEPNARGYFHGTLEEYLRVYDHAVAGATAADLGIRIGGPGGAGTDWTDELLAHCASGLNDATGRTGCRIDFLSWHVYTVGVGIPAFNVLTESLETIAALLEKYPRYSDLPTLITEWGCSSSTNWFHATSYDAAFRTMAVRRFLDADVFLTMPFCVADGPPHTHDGFTGGLGLVTKIGVPKPGFHAFELLGRMEGRRVPVETDSEAVDGLAVVSPDGNHAQVMLYNIIENYKHDPYSTAVTLKLTGGREDWRCTSMSIAPGICDPAAEWVKMGSPETVTPEQKAKLMEAARLPEPRAVDIQDGTVSVAMPGFSVLYLEFARQ